MRRLIVGLLTLAAGTGGAADAATWVRYGFTGTGTAQQLGTADQAWQSVSFSVQAYVDLDAHVPGQAAGTNWASDGRASFYDYGVRGDRPATALAGAGTLALSLYELGARGPVQDWKLFAVTGGGPGAAALFPVFAAGQAVPGTVSFKLGDGRGWAGTGEVDAATFAYVSGPGAWSLTVTPAVAATAALRTAAVSTVPAPGPVPEPAAWITLIAGFALTGAGLRYRYARGRRLAAA